jgi:hypothetical protein
MEQHIPIKKVVAVRVHRFFRVGYRVAKKMKKEDRRNMIAPMRSISLSSKGSSALNLSIVMLRAASVTGRAALLMGSTSFVPTVLPIMCQLQRIICA